MKYCFDIDNTICSGGVPYEEAKPFPKVVKRAASKFVKKPIKNHIAKDWIKKELELRKS